MGFLSSRYLRIGYCPTEEKYFIASSEIAVLLSKT
jgi:hypothetical protein